ncbi:FkbM family methyltransferase [Pelagibacteraceae bacterium]|nr:FkbM family methyltransferase [Pelagibacteraceae bacterium]
MKIIKYLSIFLKSLTYKKISYSYGGVDSLVNNIFRNNDKGFYVDVGCGHPVKNNNTYLLNKKGWHGINIDLDNENINLFDIYRPSDQNISTAISDKIGEEDLFFYHSKSAINTINKKTADYQKAKVSTIKKIRTNTLNNVLNNSKYNNLEIDFLSIDIEGSEFLALKNFDFNKYNPKVIVVEHLDLSLPALEIKNLNINSAINSDIYKLIVSKNYTLVNMLHSDLVFVNNKFRD